MVAVVTVTLDSCTVFWSEIGISEQMLDHLRQNDRAADKVWGVIDTWLADNIKNSNRAYAKGVWFANGQDAALFKLFMSGETWT